MAKVKKKMLLQRAVDVITDTVLKVRLCCSSCQGVGVGKALELQKVQLALYHLLSSQQKESLLLPIQNRSCIGSETKQHY